MAEYTTVNNTSSAGSYFGPMIPTKRYMSPNTVGPAPFGGTMDEYRRWAKLYEEQLLKDKMSDGTWSGYFTDEGTGVRAPTHPRPGAKIPLSTEDRIQIHKTVTEMLTVIEQLMGAVVEQDEQPNFELVTQATEQGKKLLKRVV